MINTTLNLFKCPWWDYADYVIFIAIGALLIHRYHADGWYSSYVSKSGFGVLKQSARIAAGA
jgi:hypothetical protein